MICSRASQYERFCKCTSDMNCLCGEHNIHEWTWDKALESPSLQLSAENLEVKFHPGYSTGTTGVRGNRVMSKGCHHYWEIKMITPVYGTDVMVGVGTKNARLSNPMSFCSLLGLDKESWGYSYRGFILHNGQSKNYTSCFGQGSIVGIHLDTWKGTLQFFLNRKPLGMAFTNLRGLDLYPMTSSTSAKSKMRVAFSCSMPASLQLDCLSKLKPREKSFLEVNFPGLRYLSQSVFAEILQKPLDDDDADDYEYPDEFCILDTFDYALVGCDRRRKRRRRLVSGTNDAENVDDLNVRELLG